MEKDLTDKELHALYLSEIKSLELGIRAYESMIEQDMVLFESDVFKYSDNIMAKYEKINGFKNLINQLRSKILKLGFEKIKKNKKKL